VTIEEKIEQDGVAMRWIRTAATTITAVGAAAAMLYGAFLWVVEPRAIEWTTAIAKEASEDVRTSLNSTLGQVDRLDTLIQELEDTVARLDEASTQARAPSWRFSRPDTSISDGVIGGFVTIQSGGNKLRDCGVPTVDLYFINGEGIYHRFTDATVLTEDGRGVAFPVDPGRVQVISYRARIPADDGVQPGRAVGFISITYPDACPQVEPAVAGPLQFRITG
jgi:hypothetical protein